MMTLRNFPGLARRLALGAPLLTCAALIACSSAPPPPPEAFVHATLGPHLDASHQNWCSNGSTKDVLVIGVQTGGTAGPMTQADMSAQFNGKIAVICSVTEGFQVNLTAALGGTQGGTLVIDNGRVNLSGSSSIRATFTSNGLNYTQPDCTVVFTYNGVKVPATPPIAIGRIWAHLQCPLAVNSSHDVTLPDGTTQMETCDLEADFEFENCT